jgi:glycosyltransferase involved in cell wall biosynthesis
MLGPPLRVTVLARAVTPLHGVGGLERSVRDLVVHLAERGVEVTLVVPPPRLHRDTGLDPFAAPHLTLRHVSYPTFPFANRRGTTILDRSSSYLLYGERAGRLAASFARDGQADVVHGFGASALGYARRRRRTGAPLVLNPQGLEEFGATRLALPAMKRLGYAPLRWAVRRTARDADAIIATDTALEPIVTRHLQPRPGQMRTIPNGIDLREVSSLAGSPEGAILRQRHRIQPQDFVLLSVGRLEANKGFDDLAAALGEASKPGSALASVPWRWVIVGAGPYQHALEHAVERAGLGSNVVMAGRASDADLHAWYEAASVFAHPTRYEGSSLVTLEAMAHGKPVIATRAGGLPDKVFPGVNGWLVEPGDVGALAAAVSEAVTSDLRALGAASRTIVERDFVWTKVVDRHIELYEELVASISRQDSRGGGGR